MDVAYVDSQDEGNPRGRRLLWTVPGVIAVQQVIIALPGDDMDGGPWALFWFLVVVALSWAAAERRSSAAWLVLLAFCVWTLGATLFYGIESDYEPAAYPYMLLTAVVLGLLLSRDSMAHVR